MKRVVEHVITIASSPGAGTEPEDEPLQRVAEMDLASFEDFGYPDELGGKLLHSPEELVGPVKDGALIRVDVGGRIYRMADLDRHGRFRLVKDRTAGQE